MGTRQPLRLTVVTPIYFGDGTGASVYYRLLTRELTRRGYVVQVISEASEFADEHLADYVGLFPPRAGRHRRPLRDLASYFVQNVRYGALEEIVKGFGADVALVHSSFLNHRGGFGAAFKKLARTVKVILDVRDVLLPPRASSVLPHADAIIACSKNVRSMVSTLGVDDRNVHEIPLPQEDLTVAPHEISRVSTRLGVTSPFLYCAGMLKESKRTDLLIRAFTEVVQPAAPQYQLVLAGRQKWRRARSRALARANGVLLVGSLPRNDAMALMAGADLVVNPSAKESIGRTSLEAIALGRPTILPPSVPEYAHAGPHLIASDSPTELGHQILRQLTAREVTLYPLERHAVDRVVSEYDRLIRVVASPHARGAATQAHLDVHEHSIHDTTKPKLH